MEYKIAEIKTEYDIYFYVIVGRNSPEQKWHVLCDSKNFTENATKDRQFKLKTLYKKGFINYKGEIVSNVNVTFSTTYSAQQFVNLLFVQKCNLIFFYGLNTGEPTKVDYFNEFIENLFLRKKCPEDGPFLFLRKNLINKNNIFSNDEKSFVVDKTDFVAVDVSNIYPVFHVGGQQKSRPSWFIPELIDDSIKTEEITIKKIISEFLTKFTNARVNNFFGTGNYWSVDRIIFQFPKCSEQEQTRIEKELYDFLKKFGKIGGFGAPKSGHVTIHNKDNKFLFWISFGALNDTMETQNKLKFAISVDSIGRRWIEPIFSENETILSYLKEKNITFDEFLQTDFAKNNEDCHIKYLIPKIQTLLEELRKEKLVSQLAETETQKTKIELKEEEIKRDIQEVKTEKFESKSEIKAAAMRSIAKKTIDLSAIAAERAATKLAKTKPMRDSIKKICQTPLLKSAFGVGIGYALPVMPVIGTKPITKEIAEEIRIEGMSGIADATIGPLMGLFDSMIEKMPADEVEEKNRIDINSSSEMINEEEIEENVERKNRS